jgi:nicotinate-nucleotide adenylyltransferase
VKIALFGGTFDPIHFGHLRAARAAVRKFRLDQILFVPSGHPPHKPEGDLTPFAHRFAMVSLACAGEAKFVPSLLEVPDGEPQYSIDTVQRFKKSFGPQDHLFFMVGMDAFLDLPHWKDPRKLLNLIDFIIVSRPGFRVEDILKVIPTQMVKKHRREKVIQLRRVQLYILDGVHVPVASHEIRSAIRNGRSVAGLIPPLVEEYIMKEKVYQSETRRRARS